MKRNFASLGFSGDITHEKIGKRKFIRDLYSDSGNLKLRSLGLFKIIFLASIVFILLRLIFLNLITGNKNLALAEGNRIKIVAIEPVRGSILDRNGKVLAHSQREYFLLKDGSETKITKEQSEELERQGLASENFEGNLGKVVVRISREYPLGEKIAHAIGYISAATQDDLKNNPERLNQDSVGRVGIEASYDNFLRGRSGKKLVEVDADGRKVSLLGKDEGEGGSDVTISIDSALQDVVFEALKKQAVKAKSGRGTVIVSDVNTGEILAMVSYPSFDPENIGASVSDQNKPFFSRAVQGAYPPGSVFKIVTALAGLESGKVTRDTEIEDVGQFFLGDIRFSNWYYTSYGKKDGTIKLDKAIARSNDIYFYRLGEMSGLDALRQMAIKIGFGQKTGIDLPGEEFGLVPDGVWKKASFGQVWFPGDTMHLAIGQGFMLVTPVQVSQMASFIASGKLMRPHLAKKISGPSGQSEIFPKLLGQELVKKENFDYVRQGMKMACQKEGTAWPFFDAPYSVGCKTGTAEQSVGNPNAWFTVFAPFDKPRIAVTVLVEDGGEGSSVAAPVAREILDWYIPRI